MTDVQEEIKENFWTQFVQGLNFEPRPRNYIRGISGVDHPLLALGVDDKAGRLLLVTEEYNARNAAMMQVDVQATTDAKVIVARAIAVDVGRIAALIQEEFGSLGAFMALVPHFSKKRNTRAKARIKQFLDDNFANIPKVLETVKLGPLNQLISTAYQLGMVERVKEAVESKDATAFWDTLDISKLAQTDVADRDRQYGICPLVLTDFSPADVETINSAPSSERVKDVLTRLDINQYFYPPADHVALALIDRDIHDETHVRDLVGKAPEIGHPYGPSEIVSTSDLMEVVEALQDHGMVIEGELGVELTDAGQAVRGTVKFKSREGFISKLINRFEIKFNLSDLFKGP